MRYTVHDRHGRLLALLGFSTAARTLAPRDRFIGWTPALRQKNLPLVIDNARFLILPWIRIPNLASHILSVVCRQLPGQWTERYNTSPVLIETFVETPRSQAPPTKPRGGSTSAPPRDAGATTATNNTTSRKRTSGFAPCAKTGNEPSTGRSSEDPPGYQPSLPCTALTGSAKISVIYPRLTERLPSTDAGHGSRDCANSGNEAQVSALTQDHRGSDHGVSA